jgi:hypothetical protein
MAWGSRGQPTRLPGSPIGKYTRFSCRLRIRAGNAGFGTGRRLLPPISEIDLNLLTDDLPILLLTMASIHG